jgi:hypothetical protein
MNVENIQMFHNLKQLNMKTIRKDYQQAGKMSLVQFATLEGEGFPFIPASKAMEEGGVQVREIREEGEVNRLLAINRTGNFCLITDMDLLKGARQNRVVNTSVLLAPHSKQELEVSCVERSRWSYNSPDFKPVKGVMDREKRAAKAASLREEEADAVFDTQSKIWDLIHREMVSQRVFSDTEDYNEIRETKPADSGKGFRLLKGEGCNGLAIFEGKRLLSFDIFGNREVYGYYFDMLLTDILARTRRGRGEGAMKKAEACYRLDEALDAFEEKLREPVSRGNGGIGVFRWSGDPGHPGFKLSYEEELVHLAGF